MLTIYELTISVCGDDHVTFHMGAYDVPGDVGEA